MFKVPGLKIIRVYTDRKEQAEFSIPNKRHTLRQSTDDRTGVPEKLKNISLHRITRKYPCPYADVLEMYEISLRIIGRKIKRKIREPEAFYPSPNAGNSIQMIIKPLITSCFFHHGFFALNLQSINYEPIHLAIYLQTVLNNSSYLYHSPPATCLKSKDEHCWLYQTFILSYWLEE